MTKKLFPELHNFNLDKKVETEPVGTDFVYVLEGQEGLVKIGTTNSLWGRYGKLRGMSPNSLTPLMFWVCRNGRSVEAAMHALFRDYRRHGEWFYFGDCYNSCACWKYRHLAFSALLTCTHPPVPINSHIYHGIQYQHIPDDDPIFDVPGGGDLTGREFYSPDLFAPFHIDRNGKDFLLSDWSDEMRKRYGFSPSCERGPTLTT